MVGLIKKLKIEDLKGLKIRMPGLVALRHWFCSVAIPGEIYPTQSGAIDATEWVGPNLHLLFIK